MRYLVTNIVLILVLFTELDSQNVTNYIGNGSFEQLIFNCSSTELKAAKYWNSIDSVKFSSFLFNYCNGMIPNQSNTIYQLPRSGNIFTGTTFYYRNFYSDRQYIKNRLKKTLIKNQIYCAKFYVNIMNTSSIGNDGFGIYFGNETLDTIKFIYKPLTYILPQVKCPSGYPISDTLGWVAVSGTFVAQGDEKYAVIGVFRANGMVDTVLINPISLPLIYTDACIDDVSCIPIDLPAYAGPDKSCVVGDSVIIGRTPDVEIDESCIWYKLNSNGTLSAPMATVAGLYVKPVVTSTYVVRQQLWCSGVKWDTVVVYKDFVGVNELDADKFGFNFFPNPATNKIIFDYKGELIIESVRFINLLGQEVLVFDEPKKEIDILKLSTGLYYLRVETNKGTKTFKLQKE